MAGFRFGETQFVIRLPVVVSRNECVWCEFEKKLDSDFDD